MHVMQTASRKVRLFLVFMLLGLSAPALADPEGISERPEVLERLFQCREIAADAERLECFDREASLFEQAEESDEIIVADRAEVQEARRGLFGLSLPKITLFSGDDEDRIDEIETTIQSASSVGRGKLLMVVEGGARWMQTDSTTIINEPEAGDTVIIRSGALGSYFAKIAGSRSFRVRRVN